MTERKFLKDSYVERNADETRQHYDAWAATYDTELLENDYSTPDNSLRALEAFSLPRDVEILDVGCGTGLFGRRLAEVGFTTIDGCDYSTGMLAQAATTGIYRSLFEANLNEPPMAVAGDRVANDVYDVASVVGVFSFGHVQAEAMDEIVRVVRPGGIVVIGLNDKFWSEGSLKTQIDAMAASDVVDIVDVVPGDHLPGTNLSGWFISLRVQ